MFGWEVLLFVIGALVAGGLTVGGVTLAYFVDKGRDDREPPGRSTVGRRSRVHR